MTDLEVGRYALRTFRHDWLPPLFGPVTRRGNGNCWADGTCTAVCADLYEPGGHAAPHEKCRCGIYGCLILQHLLSQYPTESRDIIAVIAVEGQTIMGSRGLRTQYARVVAYWTRCLFLQADHQFVGAKRFENLFEMVKAYGLRVAEEIPAHPQYSQLFEGGEWPREFALAFRGKEWIT